LDNDSSFSNIGHNGPVPGRAESHRGPPQACLFVAALPKSVSEIALRRVFERFGTVLRVKAFKDKTDKQYAFVQFQVRPRIEPLFLLCAEKNSP
jgi:RNA recognition motif-containing protein